MRAEINENGQLSVIPESPVETFALRMWWEDYMNQQTGAKDDSRKPFATLHVQLIERTYGSGEPGRTGQSGADGA